MNLFRNDSEAVTFEAGQTIFQKGDDPGGQMFAVAEGEVEIRIGDLVVLVKGPKAGEKVILRPEGGLDNGDNIKTTAK